MTRHRIEPCVALCVIAFWSAAGAQDTVRHHHGGMSSQHRGDLVDFSFTGGVGVEDDSRGLRIRCDNAMVTLDRSQSDLAARNFRQDSEMPHRGPPLPASRRNVDDDVIRARIESFLESMRARPLSGVPKRFEFELFRSVYLEGDVSVVLDGIEVLRAKSLWFSPVDDRVVIEQPVLRLQQRTASDSMVQISVRAAQLTRQHGRFVGTDVSVTTSTAGEPQFDVFSHDVEIRERPTEFEVLARDNQFRINGRSVLPLPDQHLFTASQEQLLIKSASAGYSDRLGARARIVWGSTFNDLGGSFHEWLTGRPADEFRGNWRLGTEWIEKRGFPVDLDLDYKGGDLWSGRTIAFGLDDDASPIGPIRRDLDGTPIGPDGRSLVRTENRVALGERTDLDLTAFWASDPSIYPDFYRGAYYDDERPESSAYLRHRGDDWLLTAGVRGNFSEFSYADGRQLAPGFLEEVPYATLDFFSLPVAQLDADTPLLLTSSTSAGQLRTKWDPLFATPLDDQTWRLDQELELSAPFRYGPVTVRPFLSGRFTDYERTAIGGSHGRFAYLAGGEIGTQLARDFDVGDGQAWRHEIDPTIRYENRFQVQRQPGDFFQLDGVDTISEYSVVRVGVLQRLLSRENLPDDSRQVREEVWLDLSQNFAPLPDRDNQGHVLELFEFEFLLRSLKLAKDVSLGFLFEGEQDWNKDELRTFNAYSVLRTGSTQWSLQYRSDEVERGVVGYGLTLPLRTRWQIDLRGAYDIERSRSAYYAANLIRNDLDWRLFFGITYDAVTDDSTFHIDFEPRLGGLVRQRTNWSVGGYEFGRAQILDY